MDEKKKVAVITGGSRGIGKAIALKLAADGWDLLLVAKTEATLKAAADEIGKKTRVEWLAVDLRTVDGCAKVRRCVDEKFGCLSMLVNNAGATKGGKFLELPDDVWEDGFALKFFGAVRVTRSLWPLLKGGGTVINIIGAFARTPDPDFMVGSAVNSAFASFSKALAKLGLTDDVNVNAIHPGLVLTDRLTDLFQQKAAMDKTSIDDVIKAWQHKDGIHLRRLGQPDDVANLVAFLSSPSARHITGAAIPVDGGATPGLY